jgi:ankyrin repeat protein
MVTFDEASRLIKHGNIIALRQALDEGLDPNLSNKYLWTMLMVTASTGNTKIGELLIYKGADVNKIQKNGWSAFSLAAMSGHIPFINLLLAHGASTHCQIDGFGLEKWMPCSGLSRDKIAMICNIIGADPVFLQ